MSAIHATHHAHAPDGPRFSASDRPLPPTESRTTWSARAWLWGSIVVVYALAALAIVAPTMTLALLLGAAVAGAVIWIMFRLLDRRVKSLGAEPSRARHASPHRATRRDA